MTGLDLFMFGSMAILAIVGAIIGFIWRYRNQKKVRDLPSAEDCVSAALVGAAAGALWWVTVPTAIIWWALYGVLYLLQRLLDKTGKFSD